MAESHSRSKLKRKKSSVEETDHSAPRRGCPALSPSTTNTDSNGRQLPAVETLWASTLESALPHLETRRWDPLPDLPLPSAARAAVVICDEERWCDLSTTVSAFPDPPPPPLSQDPLRLRPSPRHDLPVQTRAGSHPLEGRTASHSSPSPGRIPPLPLRKEEEEDEEASTEERRSDSKLHTDRLSDRPAPRQKEESDKREVVEDREKLWESRSVGEGGGGGGGDVLKSCPMCLQVFPVGFSQMDCDGHLALCLSQMNTDMNWKCAVGGMETCFSAGHMELGESLQMVLQRQLVRKNPKSANRPLHSQEARANRTLCFSARYTRF